MMSSAWVFFLFIGLSQSVSLASECTTGGRFPNVAETDCRGFTNCIPIGENLFYEYDIPCPVTFVFNHLDNQCTNASTYQCYPEYNCTVAGNFENKASNECSSYIACVKGLSDIVTARLIQCPNNTLFNPEQSTCVSMTSFECSPVTTPQPPVTEVTATMQPQPHNLPDGVTVRINENNGARGLFSQLILLIILSFISYVF